ncbi:MAG: hypothetical protein ABEI13_00850, partial [Candidatus Paceibacteria bacterium]
MTIRYISPYYVGFCILSLFTGIAYETGTVVVRPFDILIGMGMLVAIGKACRRGSVQALRKGAPYYLFAILYLYRGISGVVWSEPVLGVKELLQGIEFIFLIHLVTHATKRPDDRRRFLRTLHVGLGIIAVVTALLHIVNGRYSGYKFLAELGYTATQPQKYAFGLFGLTAFVFWMGERKNVHTLSVLVVAILLCFLSGERKGWMALVAAVMAIYYAAADFRVWAMLRSVFRVRYLTVIGLIVLGSMLASNFEYVGEN